MSLACAREDGPEPLTREGASPFSKADRWTLAFLLLLCIVFIYLRWVKLDTLVRGDPARWLFEAQRVAAGQMPYRDFSWQYPPFSVLVLGWLMRWFGATFAVAQIFVDTVSISIVLLAYFLTRLLLPRFFHAPVIFCFVGVCATSLMFFNLFSFRTYVPALQTAAAGFLIVLIGAIQYIRTGELKAMSLLAIAFGAFVAAYSKPETFLATYCTLAVLAIVDRHYWFGGRKTSDWLWHYTKLGIACIGPAFIAYAWTGVASGLSNMVSGITGYGLASAACPWWPTGLGMFGAAGALGEAAFIAAALSLTRWKQFATRYGSNYYKGLAAGAGGACLFFAYVLNLNWALMNENRSFAAMLRNSARSVVWTNAVLLPVMWACVPLWCYLVLRFLRTQRQKPDYGLFTMLVLLTGPVSMSARGWFNWTLETRTSVPGICYPFFLLLGPYLIWRFLALGGPGSDMNAARHSKPAITVAILLTTYGLLRVAAAYPSLLSNAPYHNLSTEAGNVRVTDPAGDSEIYRFVMENTSPGDMVLDLPYGGGMNFAAHRPGPFFNTQFQQLRMAETFLQKDLEGLHQHPPKVVIADDQPNYGAVFGLRTCSCPFPQLVWAPSTNAWIPNKIFPAFVEIGQNYRVAKIVGRKLLLVPNENAGSTQSR